MPEWLKYCLIGLAILVLVIAQGAWLELMRKLNDGR
jgi:hypothetical protein